MTLRLQILLIWVTILWFKFIRKINTDKYTFLIIPVLRLIESKCGSDNDNIPNCGRICLDHRKNQNDKYATKPAEMPDCMTEECECGVYSNLIGIRTNVKLSNGMELSDGQ